MPTLSRPGGRTVRVTNLSWLIDHAGEVQSITVAHDSNGSALLSARLQDGGSFLADFADSSIARE